MAERDGGDLPPDYDNGNLDNLDLLNLVTSVLQYLPEHLHTFSKTLVNLAPQAAREALREQSPQLAAAATLAKPRSLSAGTDLP
eukprot:SAG11_NODE_28199_length_324_cov_0.933333_1_plen_83_part_01